jgi:hypothetical protein
MHAPQESPGVMKRVGMLQGSTRVLFLGTNEQWPLEIADMHGTKPYGFFPPKKESSFLESLLIYQHKGLHLKNDDLPKGINIGRIFLCI